MNADEPNAAQVLLLEIQTVLASGEIPEHASEVAKLFLSLKKVVKEQDEKLQIDPLQKAFVDYAKIISNAGATLFNAINIFGTTMSFVIGDKSSMIKKYPHIHAVLIAMTLAFLPISLLTAGMAHALEHKIEWVKRVAHNVNG